MSDAKIKEVICLGPQIMELMQDKQYDDGCHFKRICKDFLGNHKAVNYQDVVQDLLTSYKTMGCSMSLKIHFLEPHFYFFPEDLSEVSDDHGESFHQDIMVMEKRHQDKWTSRMLVVHCWTLKRDVSDAKCWRKS